MAGRTQHERGEPLTSQARQGTSRPGAIRPGLAAVALGHPLRVALLGLLSGRASLTSTEAARELGESTGACSFHLRQLARYGHIEEVPGASGRTRPWRLARPPQALPPADPAAPADPADPAGSGVAGVPAGDNFGALARELENEGYRRWQAGRDAAPPGWSDAAFSTVLHLTPAELREAAAAIHAVIASYAGRPGPADGTRPTGGPGTGGPGTGGPGTGGPGTGGPGASGAGASGVLPVAVVARMFPLLPASADGPQP